MKSHFLHLVLLGACCGSATAQVQLVWSRDYDSPQAQADWGYRAATDSAGNVIVVGRSLNPSVGVPPMPPTEDAITLKYDSAGTLLWDRRFDHIGGADQARDVLVATDASVYTIGYSSGYVSSNYVTDMVVLKYDASGTLLWTRVFDGPGASADIPRRACFDAQGNVIVAGYSYNAQANADGAVLAYDPAGNLLWSRLVQGSSGGNDYFANVALAADGTIRAVGQANSGGDPALFVASLDAGGNILWQRENNTTVAGSEYL
ncbi:MAG: hypothetical protein ABI054_12125, partial [Planctomycetota bacterium]